MKQNVFILALLSALSLLTLSSATLSDASQPQDKSASANKFKDIYKYEASNMAYNAIGCFTSRYINAATVADYLKSSTHYKDVKIEEQEVNVERAVNGRYESVKEMGNVVTAISDIPYQIWNPQVFVYMTFEPEMTGSANQILTHYSIDFMFGAKKRSDAKQAFKSLKEDLEMIGFKQISKDSSHKLEMYNRRLARTVWIELMYGSVNLTCFNN